MTAWAALGAKLQAGETILITGVTGAAGSAAADIARQKGAKVLGAIRQPIDQMQSRTSPSITSSAWQMGLSTNWWRRRRRATGLTSCSMSSGGLFEPCLKSLAHRGRQVAIASTGDPKVSFVLVDFYHREGRLFGVDTLKLGFAESASVLRGLLKGIESGDFTPELETVTLDRRGARRTRPSTRARPERSRSLSSN